MKIKVILFLMLISGNLSAQRLISKTSHVWFYSHTAMEDIEAHNRQAVSILDSQTGDIQFSLLIKSFEFKVALMQEHFNENYMESEKFPKAGFKGKITNLDQINFSKDGVYKAMVTGELTIHGVSKELTTEGTIDVINGKVSSKAKFNVTPSDFDIAIPAVVENKIAKNIEITVEADYNQN